MIAGEEELIFVEKNHVAAGMAWSWNGDQIVVKLNLVLARDDALRTEPSPAIVSMHNALATKLPGKQLVVGNVIAVG